jgi:hypothetical protein
VPLGSLRRNRSAALARGDQRVDALNAQQMAVFRRQRGLQQAGQHPAGAAVIAALQQHLHRQLGQFHIRGLTDRGCLRHAQRLIAVAQGHAHFDDRQLVALKAQGADGPLYIAALLIVQGGFAIGGQLLIKSSGF